MIVNDFLKSDYVLLTNLDSKNNMVKGIYSSDLLSNVLKTASPDNLFITTLANLNTVAVCVMIDLPAVVICEERHVSKEMIDKANEEKIAIVQTTKKAYEVIIELHHLGLV